MPWGTPGCGARGGKELAEVGSLVGEESRERSWRSSEGGSGRSAGHILVTGQLKVRGRSRGRGTCRWRGHCNPGQQFLCRGGGDSVRDVFRRKRKDAALEMGSIDNPFEEFC